MLRWTTLFSLILSVLAFPAFAGVVQVAMTAPSTGTYSLFSYPTLGPFGANGPNVFRATGTANVTFNWDDATGKLQSVKVDSATVGVSSPITIHFQSNPSAGVLYTFDETFGPSTLQYSTGVIPVTGNASGGGSFLLPSTDVQNQFSFATYSYQYGGAAGNASGSSGPLVYTLAPITGPTHMGSVSLIDQGDGTSRIDLLLWNGFTGPRFETLEGNTSFGPLNVALGFTGTISTAAVPEAGALTLTMLAAVAGVVVGRQRRRAVASRISRDLQQP
jgi:hypothetical protein